MTSRKSLQILIPTFNRAAFLVECLESVCCQAFDSDFDVSILVVDNASTDDTPRVVEDAAKKGPVPIEFIRRPRNVGFSNNLSGGVSETRAEWVWLMGDDDFLLPGALQAVVSAIREVSDTACNLVAVRYANCYSDLSWIGIQVASHTREGNQTPSQFFSNGFIYSTFFSQYIVRRQAYLNFQLPEENRIRFTPHLKAISGMLAGSHVRFLNRCCVAARRPVGARSQWSGIWPVVYGFEHPDIAADLAGQPGGGSSKLIGLMNVRAWFVMSIFREEYALPLRRAARPSSWKRAYRVFAPFERLLERPAFRLFIRKRLLRFGGERISIPLADARVLLGETE